MAINSKGPKTTTQPKSKGLKYDSPRTVSNNELLPGEKSRDHFFSHPYISIFFFFYGNAYNPCMVYLPIFYHQKQPKCRHITMGNIPVPCIRHGIEMQRIPSPSRRRNCETSPPLILAALALTLSETSPQLSLTRLLTKAHRDVGDTHLGDGDRFNRIQLEFSWISGCLINLNWILDIE